MNNLYYDIIGSFGVALIILTYFLLQIQRMNAQGFWYSFLNAIGSGFILLSLIVNFNLAAFFVEFFWLMISVGGLLRVWLKDK